MQRYFIDATNIEGSYIHIDSYNHKHMQRVMRYRSGDQVICILPDQHVYIYEIVDIDKGILQQKEELVENNELDVQVTLIYGLPKNDKFEWVLQKATELGVSRIVPFLSKRSIIKTDMKTFDKKRERYLRILKEASEQSCRQKIPELTSLMTLSQLKDYISDINLVAYEEESRQGEHQTLAKALKKDYQTLTIVVGPEGGFDESEIQKMKENEFNINFDDFIDNYYPPKRTQHKKLASLPIIQVQNYPATVEGLKKFGNDYGIKEELINDLLNNSNKNEILNKVADELENNHMFLGTDEENKIIRRFFIEEMKEKINQINDNRVIKPIEALDMIYSELGFSDEEKESFLSNAKQKGTPGKDFYKKAIDKLNEEQTEMYKKIESLTEMVGVKKRKKVKMVKHLSSESKEVIKEDYRDLIRRSQQIFENMYNLNHMVKQGVNENVVSAKSYKIVNEKPSKNSTTINKIKKVTIKAQMNLRDKIKNFLFNNNKDLNLAVGDFVKIKDEVLPILALKVNDLIVTSKNSSIKNIMKQNNLSEAKLAFAVSSNNNTFDFQPYNYDSIEEIYKNEEENEKVK